MRWNRLLSLIAASIIGLMAGYAALTLDDLPRWFVMVAGVLALAGAASAALLIVVFVMVIVEDVRPSLRFRRPVVPLALAHREATLIGRRSYRNHPVRFWAGLTLNNRFFVGFILFDPPEYESFRTDEETHP